MSSASNWRKNGEDIAIFHFIYRFRMETVDQEDGYLFLRNPEMFKDLCAGGKGRGIQMQHFFTSISKCGKKSYFNHITYRYIRPDPVFSEFHLLGMH